MFFVSFFKNLLPLAKLNFLYVHTINSCAEQFCWTGKEKVEHGSGLYLPSEQRVKEVITAFTGSEGNSIDHSKDG